MEKIKASDARANFGVLMDETYYVRPQLITKNQVENYLVSKKLLIRF